MILGRIICFFYGHRRGKPTDNSLGRHSQQTGVKVFQCPRCGRETRYKLKDQNRGTPGDRA